MKKLLPMILLLSFSLPALAVEVKLRCEYQTKEQKEMRIMHSEIFYFDEAAKTVMGSTEGICKGTVGDCFRTYIGETEIWHEMHKDGSWHTSRKLDRMTGAYTIKNVDNVFSGTCVPFKKAF